MQTSAVYPNAATRPAWSTIPSSSSGAVSAYHVSDRASHTAYRVVRQTAGVRLRARDCANRQGTSSYNSSFGLSSALCLSEDSQIYGTGVNTDCQLGLSLSAEEFDHLDRHQFTRIPLPTELQAEDIASIAAGADTSAVLTTSGKVYTWGNSVRCLFTVNLAKQADLVCRNTRKRYTGAKSTE